MYVSVFVYVYVYVYVYEYVYEYFIPPCWSGLVWSGLVWLKGLKDQKIKRSRMYVCMYNTK